MGGSTAGSAFAGGSSFRGEPNLSMSGASSTRDPTQPGLPNRREGGHCVKTRLAPVRTSAEPSLIPHAVAERLQRRQQTKRAVLGAIRKYRLDDVAAHSPFVSFRRLMELALGAHVPSVTWLFSILGDPFSPARVDVPSAASPPPTVPFPPAAPPAPTPSPAPVGRYEVKPPVGQELVLDTNQIRYCLAEGMRLDTIRPLVNTQVADEVDRFNARAEDFNSRCSHYKYERGTFERVQEEIEAQRERIESLARRQWEAGR